MPTLSRPLVPLTLLLLLACHASGDTALDDAALQRGRDIHKAILETMESAFAHQGVWPTKLPVGAPPLVYTRLEIKDANPFLMISTVVAHEPLDRFPAGVWVCYADGHMEFAAGAGQLADCLHQIDIVKQAIATFGTPYGPKATHLPENQTPSDKLALKRTIRVLDPDGRPVVGARVGVSGEFGNLSTPADHVEFWSNDKPASVTTDANGEATLTVKQLFDPEASRYGDQSTASLLVLEESRRLEAIHTIARDDFGPESAPPIEVRLAPACRVTGRVLSLEAPQGTDALSRLELTSFSPGALNLRCVGSVSSDQKFELYLPPGDYGLILSGRGCYPVDRYIHVDPAHPVNDLVIDLFPQSKVSLIGQPAPEIHDIRQWKNTTPLTLASLRGKVVLLDFWGEWCGPCVGSMPHLMKLYDKYNDKGLEIIALHDDSVPSIAEMDKRLAERRQKFWAGRDLPFPVALDSGGETRIRYTALTVRGVNTAAYGITTFPTTLIVGRDGKILGPINVRLEEAEQKVAAALGVDPSR